MVVQRVVSIPTTTGLKLKSYSSSQYSRLHSFRVLLQCSLLSMLHSGRLCTRSRIQEDSVRGLSATLGHLLFERLCLGLLLPPLLQAQLQVSRQVSLTARQLQARLQHLALRVHLVLRLLQSQVDRLPQVKEEAPLLERPQEVQLQDFVQELPVSRVELRARFQSQQTGSFSAAVASQEPSVSFGLQVECALLAKTHYCLRVSSQRLSGSVFLHQFGLLMLLLSSSLQVQPSMQTLGLQVLTMAREALHPGPSVGTLLGIGLDRRRVANRISRVVPLLQVQRARVEQVRMAKEQTTLTQASPMEGRASGRMKLFKVRVLPQCKVHPSQVPLQDKLQELPPVEEGPFRMPRRGLLSLHRIHLQELISHPMAAFLVAFGYRSSAKI